MRVVFASAIHFGWSFVVYDFPSAAFDAAQRSAGTVIRQALGPEAAPVIGRKLIQSANDVLECIGLHHGTCAGSAVEELAKIIQRFLAHALLADNDIGPQPVQKVFIVEVDATPPGLPGMRGEIKLRSRVGRILQIAPRAPGSVVEGGGG